MQPLEQILTTEPHQDELKVLFEGIRKFNVSALGDIAPTTVSLARALVG